MIAIASCGSASFDKILKSPQRGLTADQVELIQLELDGRSFREFHPHRDANQRKGVTLDFNQGLCIWAQYSEVGQTVYEWEIGADRYTIEGKSVDSVVTIFFEEPTSIQRFPESCLNCIQLEGVSISIRNLFDKDRIRFRLNDPQLSLPQPFPIFGSWSEFTEDEIFD